MVPGAAPAWAKAGVGGYTIDNHLWGWYPEIWKGWYPEFGMQLGVLIKMVGMNCGVGIQRLHKESSLMIQRQSGFHSTGLRCRHRVDIRTSLQDGKSLQYASAELRDDKEPPLWLRFGLGAWDRSFPPYRRRRSGVF